MKKLTLFFVFATAIICSLLIVNASAATEGTAISNVEEFEAIAESGGTYYLANDIDFGGKEYDCYIIPEFSGTLDGNGHTIYNFKLKSNTASDVGIFKNILGASDVVIKDLQIGKPDQKFTVELTENAKGKSAGVIAGCIRNSKNYRANFTNVTVYANVTSVAQNVNIGGFVSYCRYANFDSCKMYGSIDLGTADYSAANTTMVGGFVAQNVGYTTMKNCENYANVFSCGTEAGKAQVGGFTSYTKNPLDIENCRNYGNISCAAEANGYCAGFVGFDQGTTTITGCENHGELTGRTNLGTIVGWVETDGTTITDCSNYGKYAEAAAQSGAYCAAKEGVTVALEGYKDLYAENPDTGDSMIVVVAIALTAISMLGIGLVSYKKSKI